MTLLQSPENLEKAFFDSVRSGNLSKVKALLPLCDPKAFNRDALVAAVRNGNLKIVELLLPVSDPKAALVEAAEKGRRDLVELLLPVSKSKANRGRALQTAAVFGHSKIVELLLPDCDVSLVFKKLAAINFSGAIKTLFNAMSNEKRESVRHVIDWDKFPETKSFWRSVDDRKTMENLLSAVVDKESQRKGMTPRL